MRSLGNIAVLTCLLLVFVNIDLKAQNHPRCFAQVFHQQYLQEQYPESDHSEDKHTDFIDFRNTHRIPVVFHVVYQNDDENISNEQIYAQLDRLNQGFNSLYRNEIPRVFQSVAATANITFCLATVQPNGESTTGITRTSTDQSRIGNPKTQAIKYNRLEGKDAWDTREYINIWIGHIGQDVYGYATFPDAAGKDFDGIVIDPKYFGNLPSPLLTAPFDMGKTLIHEMGHYLGLCHLSGCKIASCKEDDGMKDTPWQSVSYSGPECPTHPQISCQSEDMFMNYMSLAPDPCLWTFTKDQVNRMQSVLANERASLSTNSICKNSDLNELSKKIHLVSYVEDGTILIRIDRPLSEDAFIHLYDISGKLIYTSHLKDRYIVKLNRPLQPGIYILYFYAQNQQFYKKVMITQ